MAKHLVRGEKVLIGDIGGNTGNLELQLNYPVSPFYFVDLDLFILAQDDAGKIEKKNILYYGVPECFSGQLRYVESYEDNRHSKTARINLEGLPSNINKLIVACTVYMKTNGTAGSGGVPISEQRLVLGVKDTLRMSELYDFEMTLMPDDTASMLIGEIYKYSGTWKFHAAGTSDDDLLVGIIKKFFNASFT